jgi:hypothetical protein
VLSDLPSDALILLLRVAVIALLYLFLFSIVVITQRELRAEVAARPAASTRSRLIVIDPGTTPHRPGEAITLEPVTRFGRADSSTVVLDDDYVSTAHAMVLLKEDRWWIRDEGSTNGTFLNGVRVDQDVPLAEGDELQIGQVRLKMVT